MWSIAARTDIRRPIEGPTHTAHSGTHSAALPLPSPPFFPHNTAQKVKTYSVCSDFYDYNTSDSGYSGSVDIFTCDGVAAVSGRRGGGGVPLMIAPA